MNKMFIATFDSILMKSLIISELFKKNKHTQREEE